MVAELYRHLLEEKIRMTLAVASRVYHREFKFPEIIFKKSLGRTSARASSKNILWFNATLFAENGETFIEKTAPHEVAHLVTYIVHPRVSAHGPEWESVCRNIGMTDITRCHNYDVASVYNPRAVTRVKLKCGCGDHTVGIRTYKKILQGARYKCNTCHGLVRITADAQVYTVKRSAPPPPPKKEDTLYTGFDISNFDL